MSDKTNNILILYSTTDGHTLKICRRLQEVIEEQGGKATLLSVDDDTGIELEQFDIIVIGASIRYGKHSRKVYQFIEKNRQLLNSKANAFFSVNVVARKPEKNRPETNPYLQKFLAQISWKPKRLAVFAGRIDYKRYTFWDRLMIRLIMWMTKGPTDPDADIDYTDWEEVEKFGWTISEME